MIIVNYKSKRKLKKAIGKPLDWIDNLNPTPTVIQNGKSFFVTNFNDTFKATVTIVNGIITKVK